MKIILLSILLIVNLWGVMTLETYEKVKNSEEAKAYVIGVGRGVLSTDVFLSIYKKERLFCLPKDHVEDGNYLLNILNKEIEQNRSKYENDAQIENIMVVAFMNKYPCLYNLYK